MRNAIIKKGDQKRAFVVSSPDAWQEAAGFLAMVIKPGDIVTLSGPLGAGKTTFVQALAIELGCAKRPQSPTFALMRIYPVSHGALKRLIHVDAYRLENEKDALALNLDEELADGETALAIEWPENLASWLSKRETIKIDISDTSPCSPL